MLSVADALRSGARGFTRRWRPIVGASLVFLLPTEIAAGILDVERGWGAGFGLPEVAATAVVTVGYGVAFVAASRAYRGAAAPEAIRWAVRRMLPVTVLSVVACAGFVVGFFLLVVPGLVLLTRWSLAWTAYSDGSASWRSALGRSNDLVRGRTWGMFGLLIILFAGFVLIDLGTWQAVQAATNSEVFAFIVAATAGAIALPLEAAILFRAYEQLSQPTA